MASKFVRATNRPVLIAAGMAFLFLAIRDARVAMTFARLYRIPLPMVAGAVVKDVILGVALLFVSIGRSQFAGVTAVIAATILIFSVTLKIFISLMVEGGIPLSWWNGIYLALAFAMLWPSFFPWSRSANKPALFWMAMTFGLLTVLLGGLALLARL